MIPNYANIKEEITAPKKSLNEHFQSKYSTENNIIMQIKWPVVRNVCCCLMAVRDSRSSPGRKNKRRVLKEIALNLFFFFLSNLWRGKPELGSPLTTVTLAAFFPIVGEEWNRKQKQIFEILNRQLENVWSEWSMKSTENEKTCFVSQIRRLHLMEVKEKWLMRFEVNFLWHNKYYQFKGKKVKTKMLIELWNFNTSSFLFPSLCKEEDEGGLVSQWC